MPEEWFEIAYINFDKAILHGRVTAGRDEFGCRREVMIEQVLTDDQREQLADLNGRHHEELNNLLAGFVVRKGEHLKND